MVGGAYGAKCARPAPSRARARPSTPRALERGRGRAAGLSRSKRAPGSPRQLRRRRLPAPAPRAVRRDVACRASSGARVSRWDAAPMEAWPPRCPFRERDRRARSGAYTRSVASGRRVRYRRRGDARGPRSKSMTVNWPLLMTRWLGLSALTPCAFPLECFAVLKGIDIRQTAYAHGSGRESLPPDVEVEVRAGERVECSLYVPSDGATT